MLAAAFGRDSRTAADNVFYEAFHTIEDLPALRATITTPTG